MYMFIITIFLIFSTHANETPYCTEYNIDCAQKTTVTESNLDTIEILSRQMAAREFNRTVKNTLILKLVEHKATLLATFPNIYKPDKTHKVFHYGLEKKVSKNKHAKFTHTSTCFRIDRDLEKEANKIHDQYLNQRNKKVNKENQARVLANIFLGAIAAKKSIKERPQILDKIQEIRNELKINKETIHAGEFGILQRYEGITTSSSPCYGPIAVVSPKKCEQYKILLKNLSATSKKQEQKLKQLEYKLEVSENFIFKNPMYVNYKGAFTSLVSNDDIEPTRIVSQGVEVLERSLGKSQLKIYTDLMKNSESIKEDTGISGQDIIAEDFINTLMTNSNLFNELRDLYLDQLKEPISDIDKAIDDVCKSKITEVIDNEKIISNAREDFLESARDKLSKDYRENELIRMFNMAHCQAIKDKRGEDWFYNKTGLSGEKVSHLGMAATSLSLGVASAFGCLPCLPLAITTGLTSTGMTTMQVMEDYKNSNITTGLAHLDMKSTKEAFDYLQSAQEGWAFIGVDLALAPLGIRSGAMLKSGRNIRTSRKALGDTELKDNPYLFKTLIRNIPEKEYEEVIEAIKKLPLSERKVLARELDALSQLDQSQSYMFISNILKKYNIKTPTRPKLNQMALEKLSNNPHEVSELKLRYSNDLKRHKIEPGSTEEQNFILLAHLYEKMGCTGVCATSAVKQERVIKEIEKGLNCKI